MKTSWKRACVSRAGFSLIEIMVSILVLLVLVLAGAMFMQRAGSTVVIQKNKRVAIEAASRRLEQLRLVSADSILGLIPASNGMGEGNEYFLDGANQVVTAKPDETVLINGVPRPIYVKVSKINKPKNPSRQMVQVAVFVMYRADDNWVSLVTNLR